MELQLDISYSCSNTFRSNQIYNGFNNQSRNFFFMTKDQLIEYWKEMDEKIERRINYKYNREIVDEDTTNFDDQESEE